MKKGTKNEQLTDRYYLSRKGWTALPYYKGEGWRKIRFEAVKKDGGWTVSDRVTGDSASCGSFKECRKWAHEKSHEVSRYFRAESYWEGMNAFTESGEKVRIEKIESSAYCTLVYLSGPNKEKRTECWVKSLYIDWKDAVEPTPALTREDFGKKPADGLPVTRYMLVGINLRRVVSFLNRETVAELAGGRLLPENVGNGREYEGYCVFEIAGGKPEWLLPMTRILMSVGYAVTDDGEHRFCCADNGDYSNSYYAHWVHLDDEDSQESGADYVAVEDLVSGARFYAGSGVRDEESEKYYRDVIKRGTLTAKQRDGVTCVPVEFTITGRFTAYVPVTDTDTIGDIREKASEIWCEADFGELSDIDAEDNF